MIVGKDQDVVLWHVEYCAQALSRLLRQDNWQTGADAKEGNQNDKMNLEFYI